MTTTQEIAPTSDITDPPDTTDTVELGGACGCGGWLHDFGDPGCRDYEDGLR